MCFLLPFTIKQGTGTNKLGGHAKTVSENTSLSIVYFVLFLNNKSIL